MRASRSRVLSILLVISLLFLVKISSSTDWILDNCKVLGTLKSDLSKVPKWNFDRFTAPNGVDCYKIEYTLLAMFDSADIELKLDIKGMNSY
jgi:hypothetical protein